MKFYNLHTHNYSNRTDVIELVNQYPWEFVEGLPNYSIGIHPWHIDEKRLVVDLETIDQKLLIENCLALGECGLDKRIDIPMELQIQVFEKQIALAEQHQKPLVLHLVAAFDELIAIKNKLKITIPIVIHGFSKNEHVAKQLVENGFYLSFGKYLLRNPELKEAFLAVPNHRIFLETDMIEETIEEVYQKAALYKDISINELKVLVEKNWEHVFGI